ncbi:uncharacterized protein LOC130672090 isoform X2 [Microplitis mediator]|uniref:uncharacterized protein LOC130672090 isoform X2 n=1 Tax=Microplitis mediator TaxID=375433 RepID=UPI002555DAE5|nr:uncharacterized protein LOC130672090 isoform X2 [Microplitis mediator]
MSDKILIIIFIVCFVNEIFSVPIHKNCYISNDLINLIKQLEGCVEPLKENEVPIGMEFELVREYSKSDIFKKYGWDTKSSAATFVINGKIISVDLNDNSPLSRRLVLFMTDDRTEDSAVLILNFTIDRIPIDECDGTSHLKPPIH